MPNKKSLVIVVAPKWVKDQGDGKPCSGCGDRVFLTGYFLELKAVPSGRDLGRCDGFRLCQSCGEILTKEIPF